MLDLFEVRKVSFKVIVCTGTVEFIPQDFPSEEFSKQKDHKNYVLRGTNVKSKFETNHRTL